MSDHPPPHRPHKSPSRPRPDRPVYGAGPSGDPGYFASLRTGTMLAQLRVTFLALLGVPVAVLALSPVIIRIETHSLDTSPEWAEAAVVVLALLALAVLPRLQKPLDASLSGDRATRAASDAFRSALFLRFAVTEGVVLSGLPLSMAADSLLPMFLAFGLGYPMVVGFAVPTHRTIERIRARLEADGVRSELWTGLLGPFGRVSRS